MHRDDPTPAEPRAFTAASGDPSQLIVELGRLLELAVLAIPTCIGISLLIGGAAPMVTLSALRLKSRDAPVLASMSVRLPRPPTAPASDDGAELVVYAAAPHAFRDTAPSVLTLLDMTSHQVTLDAHLTVPDLAEERAAHARWLDDHALIDREVGILLDRGLLPEHGRGELARRAAAVGLSQRAAALLVIASTAQAPEGT